MTTPHPPFSIKTLWWKPYKHIKGVQITARLSDMPLGARFPTPLLARLICMAGIGVEPTTNTTESYFIPLCTAVWKDVMSKQ